MDPILSLNVPKLTRRHVLEGLLGVRMVGQATSFALASRVRGKNPDVGGVDLIDDVRRIRREDDLELRTFLQDLPEHLDEISLSPRVQTLLDVVDEDQVGAGRTGKVDASPSPELPTCGGMSSE
jgi:hypothetical protein